MQQGNLYLHPSPNSTIVDKQFVSRLIEVGFISKPYPLAGEFCWLVGDEFHELVSFMGCSPHLVTCPQESDAVNDPDSSIIYIECALETPTPKLITGKNSITPICHKCKAQLTSWRQSLPRSLPVKISESLTCPECNHIIRLDKINWRKTGGLVRDFIRINGIFPFEAVPSERLLQILNQHTGESWKVFYTFNT